MQIIFTNIFSGSGVSFRPTINIKMFTTASLFLLVAFSALQALGNPIMLQNHRELSKWTSDGGKGHSMQIHASIFRNSTKAKCVQVIDGETDLASDTCSTDLKMCRKLRDFCDHQSSDMKLNLQSLERKKNHSSGTHSLHIIVGWNVSENLIRKDAFYSGRYDDEPLTNIDLAGLPHLFIFTHQRKPDNLTDIEIDLYFVTNLEILNKCLHYLKEKIKMEGTTNPAITTTSPPGTTNPATTTTSPPGTTNPTTTTTSPPGTTNPTTTTTSPPDGTPGHLRKYIAAYVVLAFFLLVVGIVVWKKCVAPHCTKKSMWPFNRTCVGEETVYGQMCMRSKSILQECGRDQTDTKEITDYRELEKAPGGSTSSSSPERVSEIEENKLNTLITEKLVTPNNCLTQDPE
ncbi:uncharacterized protein [Hyperolius riggenbachi]|uniref:uncharacterized protein isoform X3 n=1 Tax=Hyperolius riggenbachi TaxID=752182 RepID=UPI0035A3C37B